MQTLERYSQSVHSAFAWRLVHRMIGLRLDADEMAEDEPQMFCELRSACMMCENHEACEYGLADEVADLAWQNWRNYCPNAAILTMWSVVKDCHSSVG
jgi:hypothetical protein